MHSFTAKTNDRVGRHMVRCRLRLHKGELQRMKPTTPRAASMRESGFGEWGIERGKVPFLLLARKISRGGGGVARARFFSAFLLL
jgi:hypothetical protein